MVPSVPSDMAPVVIGSKINRRDEPSRFAHLIEGISMDGNYAFAVCKSWFRMDEVVVDDASALCLKCAKAKKKAITALAAENTEATRATGRMIDTESTAMRRTL
jgi:hypothetical protein